MGSIGSALKKIVVSSTKKVATKTSQIASDTAKVATTSGRTVSSKTAKNALKGGVAVGTAGGAGAGWLLSRPTIDTDGDGEGDTNPVDYVLNIPGMVAEAVGGAVKNYWWVLVIAGVAVLVVVRK